jgi:hypothetical protein
LAKLVEDLNGLLLEIKGENLLLLDEDQGAVVLSGMQLLLKYVLHADPIKNRNVFDYYPLKKDKLFGGLLNSIVIFPSMMMAFFLH